ncbi:MAG: hypothetical protein WCO04_11160 [Pseudomonadota bacterium]
MAPSSSENAGPLTAKSDGGRGVALRVLTLVLSAVWIGAVGLTQAATWQTEAPLALAMIGAVAAVPVILAWVLTDTMLRLRGVKAQKAALQTTLDALRQSAARTRPSRQIAPTPSQSALPTVAAVASPEPAPVDVTAASTQPALALGPQIDSAPAPLSAADWLRAVHFPNSPDDAEGLKSLRLALADHSAAKLIRSAQDVLTLLAHDGIFMDNLAPDRPKPELWRKFAAGERGGIVAGLGGVRDRSCLALTAARMRNDVVFRDAAHHFLRSFDKAMVAFEPRASDSDLSALSDTRTARAFMLFGRVTGTFD